MVEVALFGWIPVCIILFACLRPVQALVISYVGAWLILPMLKVQIQGFWDLDKAVAPNVGAVLGIAMFAPHAFRSFRMQSVDVAVLLFCACSVASSVSSGLGLYDGISAFFQEMFYFGIPFLLGRIIIRGRAELLEASRIMVAAASIYALLALWEWRMSPQIHSTLYGVFQHKFLQHHRWGFYRPIVCFPHALSLGMFMAWTSVLAIWLHRSGRLGSMLGLPPQVYVAMPVLGLLASMSMGPWGLAFVALALLFIWQRTGKRIWLSLPIFFVTIWMAGRYTGVTDGKWLTAMAAQISAERADSLQYRIDAETAYVEAAKKQPVLGFGRGKQWVGQDENVKRLASDGLWVIMVGRYGLVGLSMFFLWWCWPLVMANRANRELETDPALMAQLVAVGIEAMNFMFNGASSPLVTLMSGGVVSGLIMLQRGAVRAPVRGFRPAVTRSVFVQAK